MPQKHKQNNYSMSSSGVDPLAQYVQHIRLDNTNSNCLQTGESIVEGSMESHDKMTSSMMRKLLNDYKFGGTHNVSSVKGQSINVKIDEANGPGLSEPEASDTLN